jgi:hypothetical protein
MSPGVHRASPVSAEGLQPRIAPFTFPKLYQSPLRQPAAPAVHRELRFLLGEELALFERGMNLELRIVADSRSSRHRTHGLAALLGLWSRAFACKADTCSLLAAGRHVSCPPLLRTACDCIAAQTGLARGGLDEFAAWLQAVAQSREQAALDVGLGRYRAGSVLAADQRLGAVYRAMSDLSMTHFGVTLLQVAPESDPERVSIAFADSSFHLGWAEVITGWLLVLVRAQLETAAAADTMFAVSAEAREEMAALSTEAERVLAKPDRCRIEELGDGRYLLHNFRRQAGGAPRRILL